MRNSFSLLLVLLCLAGCAAAPSISELNQGVGKTVLVSNGAAPLRFSTGVIDTSSFWAAYGSGVSDQLGGSAMAKGLQQSGEKSAQSKAEQNAAMVKTLFGDHQLVSTVSSAILPQFAASWGLSYEEGSVIALSDSPAYVDRQSGRLQGVDTDADLILMMEVSNVNLTERFSMGGALKAGLTMGMHQKSLTTEVRVALRAFKHPASGSGYEQVWWRMCGPDYTTMKTSYPLDELMQSGEKMDEILDEATQQAIDGCTQLLQTVAARG